MTTTEFSLLMTVLGLTGVCILLLLVLYDTKRRSQEDTVRINTLQHCKWRVSCIDGRFGILSNDPPRILGIGSDPDLRVAIDGAIAEAQKKAEEVIRAKTN